MTDNSDIAQIEQLKDELLKLRQELDDLRLQNIQLSNIASEYAHKFFESQGKLAEKELTK